MLDNNSLHIRCTISTLLFLAVLITGCSEKKYNQRFFALDTVIDVTFFANNQGSSLLTKLQQEIVKADSLLSISSRSSDIYRINHRSGNMVTVNSVTMSILKFCINSYQSSDSLFDITVSPLKFLYGLETHQEANRVPSEAELDSVRNFIGCFHLRIENDSTIYLDSGVTVDLGGIAKGYVVNRIKAFFSDAGVENYLVNLGGDLIASGEKPDKSKWRIGIQNPRPTDSVPLIATFPVKNTSVFSSGDYERFFIKDGIRYHHLFNPKTFKPERKNQHSTVIGEDPLKVDVSVKVAFLMDAPQGIDYLKKNGLNGLIVDSNGVIWASEGLRAVLEPKQGVTITFR
jgi:thiamine biosynthesis lipoprotein